MGHFARTLHDSAGRSWQLDQEVASGGEGGIYTLAQDPNWLAKLYHQPPAEATVDKLRHMTHQTVAELYRLTAWPRILLHDTARGGAVVGFLMPRFADYRPIQNLYSPNQRKLYFPDAEWDFLLRAAAGCAASFAAIHACGCIVGDVNQSNVLVSPRGEACLIDCDSFQVRANGRAFHCEVHTPTYTPPELQGQNFRTATRTVNHDAFGLAVLIFHLLFMGRHPFAGRYSENREVSTEELIRDYRFAYSRHAASLNIAPPPLVPTLDVVDPPLRNLFERAFLRGSERPNQRPLPSEWHVGLEQFRQQLQPCSRDAGHKIPGHLRDCPWCALMASRGPNYFAGVAAVGAVFVFDQRSLQSLRQRIDGVPQQPFAYERPLPSALIVPEDVPEEVRTGRMMSRLTGGLALGSLPLMLSCLCWRGVAWFGLAVFLVFGVWWLVLALASAFARERGRRYRAWKAARNALEDAEDEILRLHNGYVGQVRRGQRQVQHLCQNWQTLSMQYQAGCQALERNRQALAREEFLRRCFLADHKIPKIGTGRKQVLASFGVETAFDVETARILAIPGFGNVLAETLVAWRQQMLAEFRFDPASDVPRAELQALALQHKQEQDSLRIQLETRVRDLELLADRTRQEWRPLSQNVRDLANSHAQAEADLTLLQGRWERKQAASA